jgi:hypothetical protein
MKIKAAICVVLLALLASSADSRSLFTAHGVSIPAPPVTQQMVFLAYSPTYGQNVPYQTTGGSGSAGRPIAKIVPTMWPPNPPYAGTDFVLGGPDVAKFALTSTGMLSVGGSDQPAGTYNVTVSANGQTQALQITLAAQGTPWLESDKWQMVAGQDVTITVHNAPLTGPNWINLNLAFRFRSAGFPVNGSGVDITNGTGTGSATLHTFDDGADEMKYITGTTWIDNVGVGPVFTPPILMLPTQPVAAVPTAPNTLSAPFTPLHVVTACQSGCMFTDWAAAVESAIDLDYVKVEIGPGAYSSCAASTHNIEQRLPQHLWLQGYGGSFPVLGWAQCQGKSTILWGENYPDTPGPLLVVDNVRITDVICDNQAGIRPDGNGDVWVRNVIVTGTCMGVESGGFRNDITIINSRFSRDGGTSGPSHNLYIGSGEIGVISTFTMNDTISEQATNGYEVKTRAGNSVWNCNLLRGDIDPYNSHSSMANFAMGRHQVLSNNLFYEGSAVQSQSAYYSMLWGLSFDNNNPADTAHDNNFIEASSNYFIEDYAGSDNVRRFWSINDTAPVPYPSPPYVFGPNKYVWAGTWSDSDPPHIADYPSLGNLGNGDLVYLSTDHMDHTRAAAGMTPNWYDATYPMPPACNGHTIGNVSVPVLPSAP